MGGSACPAKSIRVERANQSDARGDISHSALRKSALPLFKHSFIRIDSDNVIVESVKETEDDNGVILRSMKCTTSEERSTLNYGKKVNDARRTDLLETTEARDNLAFAGNKITAPYPNYQILTVKIDLERA